ncbi:DUF4105 domain-containing protein [Glaciecola sp. MH2013]|uniref:Lnb N-terminal periplasmic domain-containing protein n=1 Tax=Glaciecola sp. MH2013 TaxID=2785524 RepID=UPI00189D9C3C|nr:DUF4105 domain-containing protein [Glaciecola sp. MH2013]MBF7074376.1 DUF4105 domain-containing protein [Glaciecola sp. MH2013]
MKLFYCTLFVFLFSTSTDATDIPALWHDQVWKKLIHFEDTLGHSEIENADFFLAPSGASDPEAEFKATLAAFQTQAIDNQTGDSVLCKYPARALYMRSHGFNVADPLSGCVALKKWLGSTDDLSISIIYADGYLENPASFYGHLLFKLNNANGTNLLTNSLNFGARVPDNENPVMYIIKGLIGGYGAEYSSNFFYRYNINYSEVEMRDLWDYKLNLNAEESLLLATHAWELLFSDYTYYFTSRNCAYHIAKMLEVVVDDTLIEVNDPFVLPISVFDSLVNARTRTGNSAVASIERQPSRQSRFRTQYHALTLEEQELVKHLLNSTTWQSELKDKEVQRQIAIVDATIEYLNFVLATETDNTAAKSKKRALQKYRIRLPLAENKPQEEVKQLPHTSHYPTTARVGFGYNEAEKVFTSIMFRPAFYDFLSSGGGILPNSALSMMETELRLDRNKVTLSSLKLLNIETMQLNATGLPGDYGVSWKLTVGNERNFIDDAKDSNEFYVEGGVGKAFELGDWVILAQLDGRLQTPNRNNQRYFAKPKLASLYENGQFKMHCELSYPISLKEDNKKKLRSECNAKLYGSKSFDLRFGFAHQFASEAQFSISYFF